MNYCRRAEKLPLDTVTVSISGNDGITSLPANVPLIVPSTPPYEVTVVDPLPEKRRPVEVKDTATPTLEEPEQKPTLHE